MHQIPSINIVEQQSSDFIPILSELIKTSNASFSNAAMPIWPTAESSHSRLPLKSILRIDRTNAAVAMVTRGWLDGGRIVPAGRRWIEKYK